MTETCDNCRFYSGNEETTNLNWRGMCRRYPPGAMPGRNSMASTPVSPEYWCGEWQGKPKARKEKKNA